jgi:hypothetical protein
MPDPSVLPGPRKQVVRPDRVSFTQGRLRRATVVDDEIVATLVINSVKQLIQWHYGFSCNGMGMSGMGCGRSKR